MFADVRFTPDCGHGAACVGCPLSAISGHSHRSKQHTYSITSSARASSVGGTVSPSASRWTAARAYRRLCNALLGSVRFVRTLGVDALVHDLHQLEENPEGALALLN